MVKFVKLPVKNGGEVPVNPDRVAYLRRSRDGEVSVVFSGFAGGLDEIVLGGVVSVDQAIALLEGPGRAKWDGVDISSVWTSEALCAALKTPPPLSEADAARLAPKVAAAPSSAPAPNRKARRRSGKAS